VSFARPHGFAHACTRERREVGGSACVRTCDREM
jgi:hypothetical protein